MSDKRGEILSGYYVFLQIQTGKTEANWRICALTFFEKTSKFLQKFFLY